MNYAYWLANIPGIGIRKIQRLLQQVGSARELYYMEEKQLKCLSGLDEKDVSRILESKKRQTERDFELLQKKQIRFVSVEDADYPKRLKNIADPPYGIYVKGELPPEQQKTVAVVGARRCSEYGYIMAKKLSSQIALHGGWVISGLAKGIDTAGHRGVLEVGGKTAAVLGSGIDVCYPQENWEVYEQIARKGCLISEYPPKTQPIPGFFPARNRIIAGLCDTLVVVEAKERSGSLITADCALEQGKDVYAVPGRMDDALSAGCNALIRQGAGMISGVEEFLEELGYNGTKEPEEKKIQNLLLEKEERLVYSCLSLRPKCMEELLQKSGLSVMQLSDALAKLVQKGLVAETFKNYYIRNA